MLCMSIAHTRSFLIPSQMAYLGLQAGREAHLAYRSRRVPRPDTAMFLNGISTLLAAKLWVSLPGSPLGIWYFLICLTG